jgi:putative DNA primase/helicase
MSASLHDLTELRLQLLANGYLPIPVTSPKANDDQYGKRPALKGWADIKRLDAAEVRNWTQLFPSACNTGILCGAIAAVDIDVDDEAVVEKILSAASEILGSGAPVRIGRAPRALLVYRTATPLRKQCSDEFVLPSGLLAKVEVLGEGQQFVAEGIHPSTRQPYRWLGASLADIRFDELPEIDEAKLGSFLDRVNRLMLDAGLERRETIFKNEAEGRRIACQLDGPVDPAVVVEALSHIPNEDAHYDFWLRMVL